MSLTALALVLSAALMHALWNIAAKKAGGDSRFALMSCLLLLVLWSPIGIWAGYGVLSKWGTWEWFAILLSALAHVLYFNILLRGYQASDLTIVYPVARGSAPLLSSIGAILILGEPLTVFGVIGATSIALGVFLIAGGIGLWNSANTLEHRRKVLLGLAYGAATGVMIAIYTVVDGYSVKVLMISPILVDYIGGLLRVPMLLPFAIKDPQGFYEAWKVQWKYALVVAVLGPLGYVLVLFAVQIAPLSHVAPAREVSMLFAAAFGGKLLSETNNRGRILGAIFMALGVIALAIG